MQYSAVPVLLLTAANTAASIYSLENNLCTGSDYVNGYWIQKQVSESENFKCCSGIFEAHDEICKIPATPTENHYGCRTQNDFYLSARKNNLTSVKFLSKSANYEFLPNSCTLKPWDEVEFCKILGNRRILMVGDSTMDQTFGTLKNMIYQGRSHDKQCHDQIEFLFSDFLTMHPFESRGKSLIDYMLHSKKYCYDIIIISTGPHYHGTVQAELNEKYVKPESWAFMDAFGPKFAYDMLKLQDVYRSQCNRPFPMMIYKTENPGHGSCPAPSPDNTMTKESFNEYNKHTKYNWNTQFLIENRLIDIFKVHNISTIRMDPLIKRPDGHHQSGHDCLHYVVPGPINLFPRLLSHFLYVGIDRWREGDGVEYSFTPLYHHYDWHDLFHDPLAQEGASISPTINQLIPSLVPSQLPSYRSRLRTDSTFSQSTSLRLNSQQSTLLLTIFPIFAIFAFFFSYLFCIYFLYK